MNVQAETFLTLIPLLWCAGKPDQADPDQIQPDRVNQVPHPHRGVHPVHRWRAAGLHRGLLPPPSLPSQAQGKANQSRDRCWQRCYRHLPGRKSYCDAQNAGEVELYGLA